MKSATKKNPSQKPNPVVDKATKPTGVQDVNAKGDDIDEVRIREMIDKDIEQMEEQRREIEEKTKVVKEFISLVRELWAKLFRRK